jgi:anti-sigma factor RsiW
MTESHERFEVLLVKATDDQLTDDERRLLDRHLESCESCRAELADFRMIKETTDAMAARIRADAAIEPARETPATRGLLTLGFLLLLVGVLLLLGVAGYLFFSDHGVPLWVKAGVGAVAVGSAALLGHALRVRARARRRDPYREVDL